MPFRGDRPSPPLRHLVLRQRHPTAPVEPDGDRERFGLVHQLGAHADRQLQELDDGDERPRQKVGNAYRTRWARRASPPAPASPINGDDHAHRSDRCRAQQGRQLHVPRSRLPATSTPKGPKHAAYDARTADPTRPTIPNSTRRSFSPALFTGTGSGTTDNSAQIAKINAEKKSILDCVLAEARRSLRCSARQTRSVSPITSMDPADRDPDLPQRPPCPAPSRSRPTRRRRG